MRNITWKADLGTRRRVIYYATWIIGLLLTALVAIWGVREQTAWGLTCVLFLFGTFYIQDEFVVKSNENHRRSLQADKKFNPGIVCQIKLHLVAFDLDSRALCVSERKDTNKYRVLYFDWDEFIFKTTLERKIRRERIKVESASYGQKLAGGALGGAPGAILASALGAKYEDGKLLTEVMQASLLVSSRTAPDEQVELSLYGSIVGEEESKLAEDCEDYSALLKFRQAIAKHLSPEDMSKNFPITRHDTVAK